MDARSGAGMALMLALLSMACLHGETRGDPPVGPGHVDYDRVVQVRYLGGGGFFVRLGKDVVLTAPFYSNPSLLAEASQPIYPRGERIARHHFEKLGHSEDVEDVRAILVGHAHYDHLMDVPYVWRYSAEANPPGPLILGSVTMRNVMSAYSRPASQDGFPLPIPVVPASNLIALNEPSDDYLDSRRCAGFDPSPSATAAQRCASFPGTRGRPYRVSNSGVQIQAFCARHPNQFPLVHQAPGCQVAPLDHLPTTTGKDYLEGESMAYLIDFLDRGTPPRIRFRVYYHDVPADGPFGRIPEDVLSEHRVDLALLCAGNWNLGEYGDADAIVSDLKPRHVLIGHWEDFFREQYQKVGPAPFQPIAWFRKLVRDRMTELGHGGATKDVVLPAPQLLKTYELGP